MGNRLEGVEDGRECETTEYQNEVQGEYNLPRLIASTVAVFVAEVAQGVIAKKYHAHWGNLFPS